MSEESRSSKARDSSGPLAGERLAAARRDQDISIRDIAKELHLDETKVQALEQNQFESLGAPVFAKGHLRKYAALVGVPADDVLADYYRLNRQVGAPPVVGPPRKSARRWDPGRYALPLLVVVLLLAGVYWFLASGITLPLGNDEATDPGDTDLELSVPLERAPLNPGGAAEPEASSAGPDSAAEPVDGAVESAPTEAAAPAPATRENVAGSVAGSRLSLGIRYSGDCWTEVTDASGERLFFELGEAGRSVEVAGVPPLRVLFGNSENVDLRVNGEPYPIPPSARRGETARFTINAR